MSIYLSIYLPAKDLKNNCISCQSLLQVHQNFFWWSFLDVVKIQFCQIFGAQPQENGSAIKHIYIIS